MDWKSQPKKRLRVLVYTTLFPNSVNPITGNFVLERMRFLRNCVDISVVAPVPYAPPWIGFNERWHSWRRVPRAESIGGFDALHPRYIVFPKIGMATHGMSMFVSTLREVRRHVNESKYDLIDAHYVYPDGFAAALLARCVNKPLVVSARGSDINLFSEFRVIRPLIRHVLLRANGLIAVSQALKERMMCLGCRDDNFAVISNGVDPEKFMPRPRLAMRQKLGLPSDRPIVLGVGHLDENKGFHVLVDAVARLRSFGLMLLIVGEGARRPLLENQIHSLGLDDDVKLIGTVPHDELSSWYSAADVFCLASSREGYPNVVLEAMACGCPVVATRVGGIPEQVVSRDMGELVDRTPQAFAAALKEALTREWDHNAIADHARSHGWDNVSIQTMNVYSRAITHFNTQLKDPLPRLSVS